MKTYLKTLFLSGVVFLGVFSTQAIPVFPTVLFDNTTSVDATRFIGAPDDHTWGLGGKWVTYDFGLTPIFNGAGQDFNVYEADGGGAEFNLIHVFVSNDGITFYDVKSSESTGLTLLGDYLHNDPLFIWRKSYDVGASPLAYARYLRVDGNGVGASGPSTGFDLDAVGALYTIDLSSVPDSGTSGLMLLLGLAGLGLYRRFSRAV